MYKVNAVTRNPNEAFYQDEVRRLRIRLVKDDHVTALRLAIVDKWSPPDRRRECDSIYENVIADQKRFLHRAGRDHEVLEDEGHNKEPRNQNYTDRGQRLQ